MTGQTSGWGGQPTLKGLWVSTTYSSGQFHREQEAKMISSKNSLLFYLRPFALNDDQQRIIIYLTSILQLTIKDHGQVMGMLEHWFIIDAEQHGVQE